MLHHRQVHSFWGKVISNCRCRAILPEELIFTTENDLSESGQMQILPGTQCSPWQIQTSAAKRIDSVMLVLFKTQLVTPKNSLRPIFLGVTQISCNSTWKSLRSLQPPCVDSPLLASLSICSLHFADYAPSQMTGQRFHRTIEVTPVLPWKAESPSASRPINYM